MTVRITILGISGSIRKGSSSRAMLAAAAELCPEGVELVIHDDIGSFPMFDPDRADSAPQCVLDFRSALSAADAVMICSPEYAHGITGVLKNALDWVVGSGEFSGKPVAAINASLDSFHAHESLVEILRTMDARVIPEASIRIPRSGKNATGEEIRTDSSEAGLLEDAMKIIATIVQNGRSGMNFG